MSAISVPSVSVSYARNGSSTNANALGMRRMQERAYEKRGEQYLLIKSPPRPPVNRRRLPLPPRFERSGGRGRAWPLSAERGNPGGIADNPSHARSWV
jgi:hypothetical protein